MSTFTWLPDYNPTASRKPDVNVAPYGDGYEQRQANGINNLKEIWQLSFSDRSITEADQIDNFLKARGAVENFDWTPPDGSAGKYVCRQWTRSPTRGVVRTIQATFEQVFE